MNVAPDNDGTPFVLSVNGKPIYVRGANWIPDDAFVTRLNRETYETSIQDAIDAGMNLLRVWGGGIYESDDFYDVCDELGMLVWQDFLFACAAYSEEEPLRSRGGGRGAAGGHAAEQARQPRGLERQQREHLGVRRVGLARPLAGRAWGEGYYFDLLPAIVAELDPRTPYSRGQPVLVRPVHPPERRAQRHHAHLGRLEPGGLHDVPQVQAAVRVGVRVPGAARLVDADLGGARRSRSTRTASRCSCTRRRSRATSSWSAGLGEHLPKWRDIDDWHWTTQLNQARAIAYGIEHFRSLFPLNTGAIVWQLNDNWPVVSWAAVDGHGIRKPLWFALRRVYADRLLTVQPREDGPVVAAHNDTDVAWSTEVTVYPAATAKGGEVLASETFALEVPARSAVLSSLPASVATAGELATEYVEVRAADGAYGVLVLRRGHRAAAGRGRLHRGGGRHRERLRRHGDGDRARQGPGAVPGPAGGLGPGRQRPDHPDRGRVATPST